MKAYLMLIQNNIAIALRQQDKSRERKALKTNCMIILAICQ